MQNLGVGGDKGIDRNREEDTTLGVRHHAGKECGSPEGLATWR